MATKRTAPTPARTTATQPRPLARSAGKAKAAVAVAATAPAPAPAPAPAAVVAPARAPAPASAPAKQAKVKAKLVRDGFTMPQADFDLIDALKARALKFQRPAKKSELLRAGLHVLTALDDALLRQALDALVPLKTGRPRKAE